MNFDSQKGANSVGWQARELQGIVSRLFRRSRSDATGGSPDAQLSEQERHLAVEREAERREHEEQ